MPVEKVVVIVLVVGDAGEVVGVEGHRGVETCRVGEVWGGGKGEVIPVMLCID